VDVHHALMWPFGLVLTWNMGKTEMKAAKSAGYLVRALQ